MARRDDPTELLTGGTPAPPPTPDATPPPASGAPAPPAPAHPLTGRTLGKFAVRERLGRGGSGEVFRAEQAQLGRTAVIKVLRREHAASPAKIERFLREARLASRLDHPYAAHVYAFGAEPDGLLWIAMEHVRGVTLDELLARRGAMPPGVFAPLFGRLCEVVHSAHELGIVHRDIKGSNVMVLERAGQLLPKLLDFGIAKAGAPPRAPAGAPGGDDGGDGDGDDGRDDGGDDDGGDRDRGGEAAVAARAADDARRGLTGHGATIGSPHYMAPEQWLRPSEVDRRADVYALGVLAYRCVAGRLPFAAFDRASLAEAHLRAAPPPLEGAPPALGAAILRALAKAPEDRWPTALAFAEAARGGGAVPEAVPILDAHARDRWLRDAPQPLADALARLAEAPTTMDADAALRAFVAVLCRWLAVVALATQGAGEAAAADGPLRARARAVAGRDDARPWLDLARAAAPPPAGGALPGLADALAGDGLAALADRLDARDQARTTSALAADVAALADALRALEPLLAYRLVVGRGGGAEAWQGPRRRDRAPALVWGEPPAEGEAVLLDATGRVAARLAPLVRVAAPAPAAEPELFLLWRGGRGAARLVAAPWGYERDDADAGARLAELTTEDGGTVEELAEPASPYPGLAAYGAEDAERFVGREREVEALANRLVRAPLVAVLGPSGVGKSSFLHAGLAPRLAAHHAVRTMRPGRHPLNALAALAPEEGGPRAAGGVGPRGDEDGGPDAARADAALVRRLRALGEAAPRGLVLVVDQLEEVATLCGDPDERRRFAEVLAAAADGAGAPVRVVATLRDDFAAVLEGEPALRGRFDVFVLATPLPEDLRRIVTEPAGRAGLAIEPAVVEAMVAEVAGRPASLPLLGFTAARLWQTRDRARREITHAAYLALGGVAGALAAYADQVHGGLARRDQELVRALFARLVADDGTRVPARRAELAQVPGAAAVVDRLVEARLLVVRDDEGEDVVELIHECLATRWPRLVRWRSEDAADRALLVDVAAAARRWRAHGRRADLLWRGQALAELRRLLARPGGLTDDERAFGAASDAHERRARRLRRGGVATAMLSLAGVAAAMAWLGVAAQRSRDAAERSAGQARTAAELAEDRLTASLRAQGRQELAGGRELPALAYFAEVLRRGGDDLGLRTMIAAAARGFRHTRWTARYARVPLPLVGPGGRWIAIAGDDRAIEVRDRDGRVAARVRLAGAPPGPLALGRAPGTVIAATSAGFAVVDVARGAALAEVDLGQATLYHHAGPADDEVTLVSEQGLDVVSLAGVRRRHAPAPRDLFVAPAFDPTGRWAALATDAGLELVDTTTMATRLVDATARRVLAVAPGGGRLAYLDARDTAHVLTFEGRGERAVPVGPGVIALVLGDDGTLGAVRRDELAVHDPAGRLVDEHPIARGETGPIRLVGGEVWTGGPDGKVRRYVDGALVASIAVTTGSVDEVLVGDGLVVASAGDGVVAALARDAADLAPAAPPPPCASPVLPVALGPGVVFACGGRNVAYLGTRVVADGPDEAPWRISWEPTTGATVHLGEAATTVRAPDGRRLASFPRAERDVTGADFLDAGHVLFATRDALWSWALATGAWTRLRDVRTPHHVAVAGGGVFVNGGDLTLTKYVDARPVATVAVGAAITTVTTSADRRWLALNLADGSVQLVDAVAGTRGARLEPMADVQSPAALDPRGELVARAGDRGVSLWDARTGALLVDGLDLLRGASAPWFAPDGALELLGRTPARLALAVDRRPAAALLRDLACRVPLRPDGLRLEPTRPPPGCDAR